MKEVVESISLAGTGISPILTTIQVQVIGDLLDVRPDEGGLLFLSRPENQGLSILFPISEKDISEWHTAYLFALNVGQKKLYLLENFQDNWMLYSFSGYWNNTIPRTFTYSLKTLEYTFVGYAGERPTILLAEGIALISTRHQSVEVSESGVLSYIASPSNKYLVPPTFTSGCYFNGQFIVGQPLYPEDIVITYPYIYRLRSLHYEFADALPILVITGLTGDDIRSIPFTLTFSTADQGLPADIMVFAAYITAAGGLNPSYYGAIESALGAVNMYEANLKTFIDLDDLITDTTDGITLYMDMYKEGMHFNDSYTRLLIDGVEQSLVQYTALLNTWITSPVECYRNLACTLIEAVDYGAFLLSHMMGLVDIVDYTDVNTEKFIYSDNPVFSLEETTPIINLMYTMSDGRTPKVAATNVSGKFGNIKSTVIWSDIGNPNFRIGTEQSAQLVDVSDIHNLLHNQTTSIPANIIGGLALPATSEVIAIHNFRERVFLMTADRIYVMRPVDNTWALSVFGSMGVLASACGGDRIIFIREDHVLCQIMSINGDVSIKELNYHHLFSQTVLGRNPRIQIDYISKLDEFQIYLWWWDSPSQANVTYSKVYRLNKYGLYRTSYKHCCYGMLVHVDSDQLPTTGHNADVNAYSGDIIEIVAPLLAETYSSAAVDLTPYAFKSPDFKHLTSVELLGNSNVSLPIGEKTGILVSVEVNRNRLENGRAFVRSLSVVEPVVYTRVSGKTHSIRVGEDPSTPNTCDGFHLSGLTYRIQYDGARHRRGALNADTSNQG